MRLGAPGLWGGGAAGGTGLVLETLTGTRRDGFSPGHRKAARRRRPEEYRWSKNVLAPINKLFTRFKKRRRATSQSLVPPGCDAEHTGAALSWPGGRAAGQAHRAAQAHCTWTWLRILQTPPASQVHLSPPPHYRQHPLLRGEALPTPAGPLPKSHSQRTRLPTRPALMSRVERGQGACRHWAPGGTVNPPGSHRSRPRGRHPHLQTILSQVPSVRRVKRRPSGFSTSKQGQRSCHADAEDSAGSGGAAASLPLDVKLT